MKSMVANIKSFYKGQTIFKEGQPSNVAYMIKKGSVNICKNINNKKIILAKLREGEIFGEMGVINKSQRTADAEAAEYCDLVILTEQLLSSLLNQCPRTIQFLTKLLIRRLQKADTMVPEKGHKSTFLSICRILDLEFRNHINMPQKDARKVANHGLGVNVNHFSKVVKDIILSTDLEIEDVLNRLSKLNIVELTSLKSSKTFSEKYVKINTPDNFIQVAESLHSELQKTDFSLTSELQYVDIPTFANYVEAEPEVIYKKIGNQDIPETLFFFHKTRAFAWADEQGRDFFKKVQKKKKKPEDFEDVNDIVFLDNATLKEVFGKLGYYKIGVLLAIAEEHAKSKITANLSKKIAAAIEEESGGRHVSDAEAEDVQMELIEMIKESKGSVA
ncbi:MAG: hypothetical protein PWQ57_1863 [Desulfovibrionales bacterium]|nr:hypothetical protein [Desulfovibrionales bacterium]